jgi:hypothetical protein
MRGWNLKESDLQAIIKVSPARMTNLMYGRTKFTDLEKDILAKALKVDETELFERRM